MKGYKLRVIARNVILRMRDEGLTIEQVLDEYYSNLSVEDRADVIEEVERQQREGY